MKSRRDFYPVVGGMLMSMFLFSTSVHAENTINRAEANCADGEVCRIAKTLVPLKILPRPRSSIFAEKSTDSELVVPTVPALSPLYVFARDDVDTTDSDAQEGWYQVGATETAPVGWMQAADVIEWHNALVLSYTAPGVGEEARNRVLGFESLGSLSQIVEADERFETAGTLIEALNSREPGSAVPESVLEAGVVAAEPAGVFSDIKDNLYMWPILSWATPEDGESDERFIEFVQLVPECRGEAVSASELAMTGDEETAVADESDADAESEADTDSVVDAVAEAVAVAISVAGSDTDADAAEEGDTAADGEAQDTASEEDDAASESEPTEQADTDAEGSAATNNDAAGADAMLLPGESGGSNGAMATQKVINIEAVRAGIADLASTLADDAGEKPIRFGFVGFQDDFEELDYIVKDFTAEGLVDAESFVQLIDENVTTEKWGDHLIPERLLEGYEAGINAA